MLRIGEEALLGVWSDKTLRHVRCLRPGHRNLFFERKRGLYAEALAMAWGIHYR